MLHHGYMLQTAVCTETLSERQTTVVYMYHHIHVIVHAVDRRQQGEREKKKWFQLLDTIRYDYKHVYKSMYSS